MTPSMEAPVSADTGGYSSIGAGLESILDAPDTQQQAAPEPPQEDVAVEEPAQDEVAEESAEDAPNENFTPDDDEDSDSEQYTDDANRTYYRVKPNKMQVFTAANKFVKEISDFAPDIQSARGHYEAASDFRALQSDFASGEPQGIQNFMGFWSQGAPEAFQSMAQQLPAFLAGQAGQNPAALAALRSIEAQVHQADVNTAYNKAAQTKDPNDLYAAQRLDFHHNGKYHDSLDKIPQRQQAQPVDQLAQRERAFEQRLQQDATQRWEQFDASALSGAKANALKTAVDNAFKVAEKAFTPGLLSAAKREAMAQVEDELKKNFEWNRNQEVEQTDIQRDFLKAIRAGRPTNLGDRAAALVQARQARIAQILPRIVKPLIGERTQAVMAQSQAQHNRLAQGAKRTSPGAGGAPAARSVIPTSNWKSASEGLDALLG